MYAAAAILPQVTANDGVAAVESFQYRHEFGVGFKRKLLPSQVDEISAQKAER